MPITAQERAVLEAIAARGTGAQDEGIREAPRQLRRHDVR